MTTIYQEFEQHAEERRRRLERRQLWFGVRREIARTNNAWIALFAGLMGVLVGILLAVALGGAMILKVMRTPDGAGICLADEAGVILPMQASCSLLSVGDSRVSTRVRVDFHLNESMSGGVRLELDSFARLRPEAE